MFIYGEKNSKRFLLAGVLSIPFIVYSSISLIKNDIAKDWIIGSGSAIVLMFFFPLLCMVRYLLNVNILRVAGNRISFKPVGRLLFEKISVEDNLYIFIPEGADESDMMFLSDNQDGSEGICVEYSDEVIGYLEDKFNCQFIIEEYEELRDSDQPVCEDFSVVKLWASNDLIFIFKTVTFPLLSLISIVEYIRADNFRDFVSYFMLISDSIFDTVKYTVAGILFLWYLIKTFGRLVITPDGIKERYFPGITKKSVVFFECEEVGVYSGLYGSEMLADKNRVQKLIYFSKRELLDNERNDLWSIKDEVVVFDYSDELYECLVNMCGLTIR